MPLLLLLLLQSIVGAGQRQQSVASPATFDYEVRPLHVNEGWALSVKLTNPSRERLFVFLDSLPWESIESIILVAVTADRKQALLEETLPVDDVVPDTVGIDSGKSLRGQVLLSRRFPGLDTALRRGPVVLFWSFQVRMSNGQRLDRQAGAFVLPGHRGSG